MSSLQVQVAQPQDESTTPPPAATPQPAAMSWWRLLPAILICLDLLRHRVVLLFTPLPVYDFMTYWASGRLFLAGSNPYSITAMYAVERSIGWSYVQPLVMLNPPWALPIVALLGLLPFHTAHLVWLAVSLILEAVSAIALWRYFGGEKKMQWIALVLFVTFLPLGSAEHMGQITPLILAGLTAFLFLLRRQRYVLAGVCLLTLGLKPHLLYLVLLALLLWTIQTKRWALASSAIFTYGSATLAAILFNRNVLGYFHGTVQAAVDTSCGVGGTLRSIFGMQHTWLQFLPTAIGTAWFASYWIRNRRGWTWEEHLPLVLLVSLSTAPYSWAHDYILAFPSFIALTVAISRTRTDWLIASALLLVVQIEIYSLIDPTSKAWLATASLLWLVLYKIGTVSLAGAEGATVVPQQ
jgi:hypothetical protein